MKCPNVYDCPNPPVDGFSAETNQGALYQSVSYSKPPMPLGASWGAFGARAEGASDLSQSLADMAADAAAQTAALTPPAATPPTTPPTLGNTAHAIPAQECCRCLPSVPTVILLGAEAGGVLADESGDIFILE